MEISRSSCRLCMSESEFNIPLFGSFSRRTNMLDKILVCLKIVIEESDFPNTICYKCANKIETYYDFTMSVKKSQTKLGSREFYNGQRKPGSGDRSPIPVSRRHVSYVREQVFDADCTFSFFDAANVEEKQEAKVSSAFFSYFSPADGKKQSNEPTVWKTPVSRFDAPSAKVKRENERKKQSGGGSQRPRQLSSDMFASQSQDGDAEPPGSFDWKLVPDNSLLKIVKEKCFGRSDF